jgi:hypothetical protein
MSKPPAPDKLIGAIKYRPPKGKPQDRPLERIRQELEVREKSQGADRRRAKRSRPRARTGSPCGSARQAR